MQIVIAYVLYMGDCIRGMPQIMLVLLDGGCRLMTKRIKTMRFYHSM